MSECAEEGKQEASKAKKAATEGVLFFVCEAA